MNLTLPALLAALMVSFSTYSQQAVGGGACVTTKELGDTLDISWVVGAPSVTHAINRAKQELHDKGFEYTFPQANSSNEHGWLVVIKTNYRSATGRQRNSYGCGFSSESVEDAEARALTDLRTYSWGWRQAMGYQVVKKLQY